MTTTSSGQTRSVLIAPGRRRAAMLLVASLVAAGAAGCGSSDSSALDEYTGTWTVDQESSHFTLNCAFLTAPIEFPLWSSARIEEGTLSDLIELAGPCPSYLDVTSKGIASMTTPDPFTGEAPFCDVSVSEDEFLELRYTMWEVRLLAPVKGQAPKGQMLGSAAGQLFLIGADGTAAPEAMGDCTYVVNSSLTKIGKN